MIETTQKERPILFSGPMVRAILDGRKTQTRRVVKPQPADDLHLLDDCKYMLFGGNRNGSSIWRCPYGEVGDLLWVRETWQFTGPELNDAPGYVYRSTDPDWESMNGWKWKPSIFMPRNASRITLEITAVRAERLHAISEADAIKEGAQSINAFPASMTDRGAFAKLWEKINGIGSWDQDPWVWVVEFKRK